MSRMSRRFDYSMKKGKGRRKKDNVGDFTLKTYGIYSAETGEVGQDREGEDVAATSPDADGMRRELSGTGLSLTVHSVPLGGTEKSNIGNELVGVTDRISKLLSDYESLYEDEETSRQVQQSVKGQIYMDSLLSNYDTLCQEREEILESLQDSLDLDEEEVLDQLEKTARETAAEVEGSETIVMETFKNAKVTFEKLKDLNEDMMNRSTQGKDTSKLEQEKQALEDELTMYKRMATHQRMDNAYKSRRRASVVRNDETQQWKLVAGEMLNIVKGIKNEGKLDRGQLEKDLNNILMAMNDQNATIEKLKLHLTASEKKCSTAETEKVKIYRDMQKVEEDLETKHLENAQCKRMIKQLQTEKKMEKIIPDQDLRVVTPEADITTPTPVVQDTAPTDLLQAQLRDQKNKATKFEAQNKEFQKMIEEFENESRKRRENEMNVAQMVVKESGDNVCPNCQLLGIQVLSSRDEMVEQTAKINKLEKQLVSVRGQLNNAQKETEVAKKRAKGSMKQEVVTIPAKEPQIKAPPTTPAQEIVPTQAQATSAASPPADLESSPVESPDEEPDAQLKPTKKTKAKKLEWKTSSKAKKTPVKTKPEESAKEPSSKEPTSKEPTSKEPKEEEVVEKKKKEELSSEKKSKEEEFSSDEKAPYVKVREAKLMTLCDKGTQTGYLGRMAAMNNSRRESIGSWKASKDEQHKHSLTEAIMAIAPPPVVEQETSLVMSTIFEESNRLCEEISTLMEYGFELVQQQASSLQTQTQRYISVENAKELVKEGEHDVLPSIDRRMSLYGGGAGSRRRSSILQLDTRRGSIRNRESMFAAELFGRKRADALLEVDEEIDKPSTEPRQQKSASSSTSTAAQEGTGETEQEGPPVTTEDQLKHSVAAMAQQAIDIIKSTGEVISFQLNHKLGYYEKFYDMWKQLRQQRRQSFKSPVTGRAMLVSVSSFEKAERRPSWCGTEDMDVEPGMLFPQIAPYVQTQTNKGTPISTAKLSNQGMMMIGSNRKPEGNSSPPQSTPQMKKRGKPMTRQQQMMKQKALLDKVLHVDSPMQDIHNMVGSTHSIRTAPQGNTPKQSFNLPFIAHGILGGQETQLVDQKIEAVRRRMSLFGEVHHTTTTWSSKDAIPKYHSANEVPLGKSPPTKSKPRARMLPSLTISNFFK